MAQAQLDQIDTTNKHRVSFQDIYNGLSPLLLETNGNSAKFTSSTELRHTILGLAYYVSKISPQNAHHLFTTIQNKGQARKNQDASSGDTNWNKVLSLGGFNSFSPNRPSSLGRLCNPDENMNTCFIHCKLIAFFIHLLYKARGMEFDNVLVSDLSRRYMTEEMSTRMNVPADIISISDFVLVIDYTSFKLCKSDFPYSVEPLFGELPWIGLEEEAKDTITQTDKVDSLIKRFNYYVKKREVDEARRDKVKSQLISLEQKMKERASTLDALNVSIHNADVKISSFVHLVKSGITAVRESDNSMLHTDDEDSGESVTGDVRRGTKRGSDSTCEEHDEHRADTDETIAINSSPGNIISVRSESHASPSSSNTSSLSDTMENSLPLRKFRPCRNLTPRKH